ncbi:hypothetical protein [Herpetosiphon geysericola]|uniref:Uncharacterized protein n=1 Tax=Herpetosiphon geysericola TaxID=70996 RepID=A0A0P6Y9Z7_9CHLR|nr:hypothetical protein [Herpetosiphon geysericola]KPL86821.1 hypothetical protein SE18_12775 [Herpetosiphon geysericola]
MSDELDHIPWSTIYQHYDAGHNRLDTAQQLRNLIHPDPTVVDKAYAALEKPFVGFRSVSTAGLEAFPYLLSKLFTAKGYSRTYISDLVMQIVESIAPAHPSRTPWFYFVYDNGTFRAHYGADSARIIPYALVIEEFPNLLPLLHDPDEQFAQTILRIVACCVAVDGGLWAAVLPCALAEQRPLLQASYQFVAWASADLAALAWVSETFDQAQEPLVKLTAAFVMTQTAQQVPETMYAWLIATVSVNNLRLIETYNALGLAHSYWFDCALMLYRRPLSERIQLAEQCLAYLEGQDAALNDYDVAALLMLALGALRYKKSTIERADIHAKVVLWIGQQLFTTTKQDRAALERILRTFRLPWRPATVNGFLGLPNAEHAGFAEKTKP